MNQPDFYFSSSGQLVRDYVPELARRDHAGLLFTQAPPGQLDQLMAGKIVQETCELADAATETEEAHRLAALYDLIEEIAARRGLSMADLADRARRLRFDKGGFGLRMMLVGRHEGDPDAPAITGREQPG